MVFGAIKEQRINRCRQTVVKLARSKTICINLQVQKSYAEDIKIIITVNLSSVFLFFFWGLGVRSVCRIRNPKLEIVTVTSGLQVMRQSLPCDMIVLMDW